MEDRVPIAAVRRRPSRCMAGYMPIRRILKSILLLLIQLDETN